MSLLLAPKRAKFLLCNFQFMLVVAAAGLRVDSSNKLQERLRFLRDMLGVEHAIFFTFEGESCWMRAVH